MFRDLIAATEAFLPCLSAHACARAERLFLKVVCVLNRSFVA